MKKKLEGFGVKLGTYMKHIHAEKYKIIHMVESPNLSIRKILEQIGAGRSTFYERYRAYQEDGYDGLRPKITRPQQFWNRMPDTECQKIRGYAQGHPWMSCREVAADFTDEHGYFISQSSGYRILKVRGLIALQFNDC